MRPPPGGHHNPQLAGGRRPAADDTTAEFSGQTTAVTTPLPSPTGPTLDTATGPVQPAPPGPQLQQQVLMTTNAAQLELQRIEAKVMAAVDACLLYAGQVVGSCSACVRQAVEAYQADALALLNQSTLKVETVIFGLLGSAYAIAQQYGCTFPEAGLVPPGPTLPFGITPQVTIPFTATYPTPQMLDQLLSLIQGGGWPNPPDLPALPTPTQPLGPAAHNITSLRTGRPPPQLPPPGPTTTTLGSQVQPGPTPSPTPSPTGTPLPPPYTTTGPGPTQPGPTTTQVMILQQQIQQLQTQLQQLQQQQTTTTGQGGPSPYQTPTPPGPTTTVTATTTTGQGGPSPYQTPPGPTTTTPGPTTTTTTGQGGPSPYQTPGPTPGPGNGQTQGPGPTTTGQGGPSPYVPPLGTLPVVIATEAGGPVVAGLGEFDRAAGPGPKQVAAAPPAQPDGGGGPRLFGIQWPDWCDPNVCKVIDGVLAQIAGAGQAIPDNPLDPAALADQVVQAANKGGIGGLLGAFPQGVMAILALPINFFLSFAKQAITADGARPAARYALGLMQGLLNWIERLLGITLDAEHRVVEYAIAYLLPNEIPNQGGLDASFLAELMTEDDWTCYTKALAHCPELWRRVRQAKRSRPSDGDIHALYRRQMIDQATWTDLLRQNGWTEALERTRDLLAGDDWPSGREVVDWMLGSRLDPPTVARWGLDVGFNDAWNLNAQNYSTGAAQNRDLARQRWISQRSLPGVGEAIRMWWRLDTADPASPTRMTEADLDQVLAAHGYPPFWIARIKAAARPQVALRQLYTYVAQAGMGQGEFAARVMALGYTAGEANEFWTEAYLKKFDYLKGLGYSKQYQAGGLTSQALHARLVQYGALPAEADAVIRDLDQVNAADMRARCARSIRADFLRGGSTLAELQTRLIQTGMEPGQAVAWAQEAYCELGSRDKLATQAQLVRWFGKGILSAAELAQRLANLGLRPDTTTYVVTEAVLDKQRKAAAAAQKQTAAAQKAAAKQVSAAQKAAQQKATAAAKEARAEERRQVKIAKEAEQWSKAWGIGQDDAVAELRGKALEAMQLYGWSADGAVDQTIQAARYAIGIKDRDLTRLIKESTYTQGDFATAQAQLAAGQTTPSDQPSA